MQLLRTSFENDCIEMEEEAMMMVYAAHINSTFQKL